MWICRYGKEWQCCILSEFFSPRSITPSNFYHSCRWSHCGIISCFLQKHKMKKLRGKPLSKIKLQEMFTSVRQSAQQDIYYSRACYSIGKKRHKPRQKVDELKNGILLHYKTHLRIYYYFHSHRHLAQCRLLIKLLVDKQFNGCLMKSSLG